MTWEVAQTLLRTLLKVGAGSLITRGVLQSEEAEQLIGAVILTAGVLWGIFQRRPPKNTP